MQMCIHELIARKHCPEKLTTRGRAWSSVSVAVGSTSFMNGRLFTNIISGGRAKRDER